MKLKGFKINARVINRVVWGIAFSLGVYYIVSVNALAISGFELKDAKERISYLASQNADSESKVMSLESLSSINARLPKLKLVKVDNIEYVSAGTEVVAKR